MLAVALIRSRSQTLEGNDSSSQPQPPLIPIHSDYHRPLEVQLPSAGGCLKWCASKSNGLSSLFIWRPCHDCSVLTNTGAVPLDGFAPTYFLRQAPKPNGYKCEKNSRPSSHSISCRNPFIFCFFCPRRRVETYKLRPRQAGQLIEIQWDSMGSRASDPIIQSVFGWQTRNTT